MNLRTSHSLVALAATMVTQGCSAGRSADEPRAHLLPAPEVAAATQDDIASLRAEGPAALERLLAAHDVATGDDRARLAAVVDAVAAQRYATVSRLYWYTDLEAARAASRASGKPILSLRLLGRLDEDLSCANSRFFRVALYANAELSAWLRDSFVLHWSSERPVPKLTIDFGDGRRLATTIAGNSAHYVLDGDGGVVDVLPGLMTPRAFRHELESAIELFDRLGDAPAGERAAMFEAHHAGAVAAIDRTWKKLGKQEIPASTYLLSLAAAQRTAMAKSRVELPVVKTAALGPDPSAVPADGVEWEQIGVRVLAELGLETAASTAPLFGDVDPRILPPPAVLDAQSLALIDRLAPVDWADTRRVLADHERAALIRDFESAIVADSGQNLTRLRRQIHDYLADQARSGAGVAFERVNTWIYANVFLTPAADAWLGMATPGVFTGLPRDGVVQGL